MSPSTPRAPGRRTDARRARLDVTTALAIGLPVLCLLALALVRPAEEPDSSHAPTRTALTKATAVCPSPMEGASDVAISSAAEDARGEVTVRLTDRDTKADLASGEVITVDGGSGPVAVIGEDEAAPGLVAARFGEDQTAAVACRSPLPHQWFTGVGAGAGHASVLELVNPDAGTAVADVTVYGRRGVVDAPRLRGVSVPGRSSVRLDLAALVPRTDELALEVVASRGRIGASVLDRFDEIGSAPPTEDWLPAQVEPATTNLLLGPAPGKGERVLALANPGDSEVRADLRVVTDTSAFEPEGSPEIRIPPQSVEVVPMAEALGPAIADGAIGVEVTSTGPVTATLRSTVAGDVSHAVGGEAVRAPATVLLPDGGKTLALAGAASSGVVQVTSRAASGKELDTTKVEIAPGRGVSVELPDEAVLVTVSPSRTRVTGAVVVTGADEDAVVVTLVEPLTNGLVPDVRPGLP